jgi:POT family proton-dependent oligopeptide transporter
MAQSSKHPKGLPYLFFTEMWERFGYYLMLGIFVLYMIDVEKGGLAIADKVSYDIFGTFIAITYLTPFLGGFLADKKLGYIKSVYIGGVLMGLGYMGLGIPGLEAFGIELSQSFVMASFWISMLLIVAGNGFFKPSISTLLGNLYSSEEYKEKKDWGYNLFYMGINIGALLGPIFAAFMRNKYNWSASFFTAGIGMFIGLIVFTIGLKHVRAGERNTADTGSSKDSSLAQVLSYVFLPAIAAGLLGWFLPGKLFGGTLMDSKSTDAFLFASVPVIIFYVSLWLRAKEGEKRPIAALLAIFAVSVVFWAVFKQNGTALTNWGKYYTDREVPQAVEGVSRALYQVETMQTKPDSVNSFDEQFRAQKANDKPVKTFGRHVYFRNLPPERIPQNGEPVYLISTELFQSINPFWVVLLTPLVIAAFAWLRKRKKEPTTPGKIALGLVISALSTLVMVGAVYASNNGAMKVSTLWLVGCYGVITVGELCLSPMGLSLVSKLSPPRFTALMMGGFFLSTSIGNKMSGVLAGMWYGYENKANFFLVNCILLMGAGLAAFMLLKWLNKVMEEKGLR